MHKMLITSNPKVMMGKPTVTGTRITVELIRDKLVAGETVEQILSAHSRLTAMTFGDAKSVTRGDGLEVARTSVCARRNLLEINKLQSGFLESLPTVRPWPRKYRHVRLTELRSTRTLQSRSPSPPQPPMYPLSQFLNLFRFLQT